MASDILPRSAWTSTPEGFSRRLVHSRVEWVALHYPGSPSSIGAASQAQIAALLRGYRRYHINSRGWADIGYCLAVDQAGRKWSLAGERVAAHSASKAYPDANHEGIGILLLLGNTETPSAAMIASVNELIDDERRKYTRISRVLGHRQVRGAQTSCPGDRVIALIGNGTIDIGKRGSTPAPKPTPKPEPKPAGNSYPDVALLVDGVWGSRTTRALQIVLPRKYNGGRNLALTNHMNAATWMAVQRWLKNLGYYKGRIDGVGGPMTKEALQSFLYDKGLYRNGRYSKAVMVDGDFYAGSVRALQAYLNDQRQYL